MADTPVAAAVEAVRQPSTNEADATAVPQQAPVKLDPNEAFARKERALRRQQQELQAEKQQWLTKQKDYETNYIPRSRISEDPLSILQENGVPYDKLTELILAQPNQNDPTVRMLRAEIKALADKQSNAEKAQQEAVTAQYEQAKKQIMNEVTVLVDSDTAFETIKAEGLHEAVTELVIETFNTSGVLMDIEDAARQIEDHLVEQGYKMAQYNKVKARLTPKTEEPESGTKTVTFKQTQPKHEIKTLTHRMQQDVPKKDTDKEKRERAIAAFYGQNKG